MTGNLIGTELTQVAPLAGHVGLMLFDLLISTWSLSLAGFALGLLGGLSMVNHVVDGINKRAEKIGAPSASQALKADLEAGRLVDLERFVETMRAEDEGEGKSDEQRTHERSQARPCYNPLPPPPLEPGRAPTLLFTLPCPQLIVLVCPTGLIPACRSVGEIFRSIDVDNDGTLSRQEYDAYVQGIKAVTRGQLDALRSELLGEINQLAANLANDLASAHNEQAFKQELLLEAVQGLKARRSRSSTRSSTSKSPSPTQQSGQTGTGARSSVPAADTGNEAREDFRSRSR